jgi:hypothetical protein
LVRVIKGNSWYRSRVVTFLNCSAADLDVDKLATGFMEVRSSVLTCILESFALLVYILYTSGGERR